MFGLIGKKLGMSVIFINNLNIACSLILAGPCQVLYLKNEKKNGYNAVQLGFDEIKKNINSPLKGYFHLSGNKYYKKILEFKNYVNVKLGEIITVNRFKVNDNINVSGLSKGKGFQGVVKRHNFSGVGSRTHGQHNRNRAPGSIGAGSSPSRVFKGMKMAGRMGGNKITIKNLKVLKVDGANNILLIKGSVPGNSGNYLKIWI